MRTFPLVTIGAVLLFAVPAFAGTSSFDATLKLPPYSAPNLRSAGTPAPKFGEYGSGSDRFNRMTLNAQERQCRQDLRYASQSRGISQSGMMLQREFSAQSVYDLPGFGNIPYCIWYPQWRLRQLFGPARNQSIRWPVPQPKTFPSAAETG